MREYERRDLEKYLAGLEEILESLLVYLQDHDIWCPQFCHERRFSVLECLEWKCQGALRTAAVQEVYASLIREMERFKNWVVEMYSRNEEIPCLFAPPEGEEEGENII